MKIATYLGNTIESGGGFNQSLSAIAQLKGFMGEENFIVVTTRKKNIPILKELGINSRYLRPTILDAFLRICTLIPILRRLQSKFRLIGTFESHLLKENIDLVYFLSPSIYSTLLQKLNYIITIWDLCHSDFPEFPEVREFNEFFYREDLYAQSVPSAVAVIVDSHKLKDKVVARYGVDTERIITMPFSISPFIIKEANFKVDVLTKYDIKKGYFFYPAQFWAHKNHIRILEALMLLKEMGMDYEVVFCGADKGNLAYINEFIKEKSLQNQVKIVGFVTSEDLQGLYEHCLSVVMPTYFGQTNIPPLEAWHFGKPLIYSRNFNEQAGDAALFFNPDSAEELAKLMREVFNSVGLREQLRQNGYIRLSQLDEEKKIAEKDFHNLLINFEKRRLCWA